MLLLEAGNARQEAGRSFFFFPFFSKNQKFAPFSQNAEVTHIIGSRLLQN
jgi:hypothetical protein